MSTKSFVSIEPRTSNLEPGTIHGYLRRGARCMVVGVGVAKDAAADASRGPRALHAELHRVGRAQAPGLARGEPVVAHRGRGQRARRRGPSRGRARWSQL